MRRAPVRALLPAFLLLAGEASARIVPSAPVSQWPVIPAVQKRAARHVVVIELVRYGESCYYCVPTSGRLVVHDSLGLEAPRDVTPGGQPADIEAAAAWEGADGTLRLFVTGHFASPLPSPQAGSLLYSADGGATWAPVAVPPGSQAWAPEPVWRDAGGPIAHAVGSPIRLGTAAVPFVVSVSSPDASGIWGVRADGSTYSLTPPTLAGDILGSDVGGSRFLALLRPAPPANSAQSPWTLALLDLAGNTSPIFDTTGFPWNPWMEGWIAPDGSAYLNVDWTWGGNFVSPVKPPILPSTRSLVLWKEGSLREIVSTESGTLLGIPAPDFAGAWILNRGGDATVLASHTPSGGLVEAWRDGSRPRIEGVFASESGRRLLFLRRGILGSGPGSFALTVWEVGQPAPSGWDRVVLSSEGTPTLVHLDVDAAAVAGAPIFADPGSPLGFAMPSGEPPAPNSPSFFQTNPLLRLSLRQELVVPASARAQGLFGASWRTDLVLRNPGASAVPVTVRFLPNPRTAPSVPDASVTVEPRAIAVVPDVLGSLFGLESGSGALRLLPAAGGAIDATSRTYTVSSGGSYGMALDAEDVIAGSRLGFAQSFPAVLLGSGFRTNLIATGLSRETSRIEVLSSGGGGATSGPLSVDVPAGGQGQVDDVAALAGASGSIEGSFLVTSRSGSTMTGFTVIDNATNDPAWSGPAVPPGPLTIPAVVHSAGAHGAEFRTDLFFFNPDPVTRTVPVRGALWTGAIREFSTTVTLAPGESKRIPDALFTLFGLTGVARLSFWSGFPDGGVAATSRTYTLLPDGSTYGMLVPPLTPAQVAGAGETLEILGPTGGAGSRTNLSLVKLDPSPGRVDVRIFDESGALLDGFERELPAYGGVQVDDLFRARGLGDGPKAALIQVSFAPGERYGSRLAAYATTIDNATNDPVYFAGRLAAVD